MKGCKRGLLLLLLYGVRLFQCRVDEFEQTCLHCGIYTYANNTFVPRSLYAELKY